MQDSLVVTLHNAKVRVTVYYKCLVKIRQQVYEKVFTISNHKKNANQNHYEESPVTIVKKNSRDEMCQEGCGERRSLYAFEGNVKWYNHYRKQYGGLSKNKNRTIL